MLQNHLTTGHFADRAPASTTIPATMCACYKPNGKNASSGRLDGGVLHPRKVALTALLFCLLMVLVGCAQTGSSEGACAGPYIRAEPARAAPAGMFRLHGRNFSIGDCERGTVKPIQNIPIDFRQGKRTWRLTTVINAPGYFNVEVRVPAEAKPGRADVIAITRVGKPRQPFQILRGDTDATSR